MATKGGLIRVIIAGGRNIKHPELVAEAVEESNFSIDVILSGNAAYGVDKYAEEYGFTHNIPVELYPADWNNLSHADSVVVPNKWGGFYDARAGFRRNEQMVKNADALIVIWDGKSNGSKNVLEFAQRYGIKVYEKRVDPDEYNHKKKLDLKSQIITWARELRQNTNAVVVDTESTGGSATDEIISIAIVRLHNGEPLFNSLLRPMDDVKFNWFATKVHGIQKYHLTNSPTLPQVWDQIFPILHKADVLAYNYSADKRMITQTANKYGLEFPDVRWHCIMKAYKNYTLRGANINLTAACNEMKVKAGTHDALDDSLAAARLMYRIAQGYNG